MELHPLLVTLANIVNLRPRQRRLVHALLTEVDGDDDARAPCRTEALATASAAIVSVEMTASAPNGGERQRRAPGRLRAPAEAKPAPKASAAPEPGDWLKLRGAIRAAIRDRGLTRREAAIEGNFNIGTFARWLSRTARPPGRAAQEQLRAWVDKGMPAQHPPAPPAEAGLCPAQAPLPAIAPPAAEPANNGQDGIGAAPSAAQPRLSRRGESLPAYKLTETQQSRLVLTLQHNPGVLRGVATREVAQKAAAGQRLAPEIIRRLVEIVDQLPPGNGAAE